MLSAAQLLLLFTFVFTVLAFPRGQDGRRHGGWEVGGGFGGPAVYPDYSNFGNFGFPNNGRSAIGSRGGGPCPSQTSSTPLSDQQVEDLTDSFFASTEEEQRLMLKDFLTSLGGGSSSINSANSVQYPNYGDYGDGEDNWSSRRNGNRGGHGRRGRRG